MQLLLKRTRRSVLLSLEKNQFAAPKAWVRIAAVLNILFLVKCEYFMWKMSDQIAYVLDYFRTQPVRSANLYDGAR